MKLSFIIFMLCMVNLSASVYSQNTTFTLKLKDQSVKEVLDNIENSSEFRFFYNDKFVDMNRRTTVDVKNKNIADILNQLFYDTSITYQVLDNNLIVITPREILQGLVVTGTVTDNTGAPMPGVNITIKGTVTGAVSDVNGKFTITVPNKDAVLLFSFIGYISQEMTVGDQRNINITLAEDTKELEEVVVVGYATQKKATLTGAVSSIKSADIVVTKNENVQNMLTGKVPGVRVWQKSAEPGEFRGSFDIRGMGTPLVVIDGIPRTMDEFQRLTPNDIENISVLKDGSAAIYGVRSANGVVLVTTKSGTKSAKPEVTYEGSYSFTFPSGMPGIVDAIDYIRLQNESSMRNINNLSWNWSVSEETLNEYINGTKKGYDWYDYEFKKYAPQTQHNINLNGGNDRTTYYVGAGYLYQNSFFNTDDRKYDKWNMNARMTTKLSDNLTFDLHLSAIMDQRDSPNQSAVWTIRDFWRMNPLVGPYADPEETMYSHDVVEGENPFSFIHSDLIGWQKAKKRWFDGQGSLKYDLPWVKGLSIKGTFGYNYYVGDNTTYKKEYYQYIYRPVTDSYQRYTVSAPSQLTRSNYIRTQMLSNFVLNYENTFGRNRVSGLLVWESQWRNGDNFNGRRDLVIPLPYLLAGKSAGQIATMYTDQPNFYETANNALAGQFNYAFADKYILEFLFRYDGSSMWDPAHQWGFFPGGSVAWRISEEDFFKSSSLSFIQQLKLRASFASTGDDAAAAYQWMSGYNYPTSGRDWFNSGRNASVSSNGREFSGGYVFNGGYVNSADNKGIPNPNITWYKANIMNLGIDFEAWRGLFGFTFEYFNRTRKGLLAKREGGIPTVVGAMLPDENLNSDQNYGFELQLTHRNKINDFVYRASAMASITRKKQLDKEEATRGSSWNYWTDNQSDRLQGIYRGFGYEGQYQSWEDIWNSPIYIGRGTLPGDYIWEDWNGDGIVDDNDKHPIRFDKDALMFFSASFGASYKRFDLDVLFQGSALGSLEYGEQMRGDSRTLEMFTDRWRPTDPKADPWNTSTEWTKGYYSYANGNRRDNSEFNVESTAYLRLKNIELGYNLPEFKGVNLRVYVSGYNVFTITKVKNVDPEHPGLGESWGFHYPLDKKLTFGLTLKF